jgi:magnesium transporter
MNSADNEPVRATRLKTLRAALDTGTMRGVRRLIAALNAAEIADLLESLPPTQRQIVWGLVEPADEGDILVELNEEVRNTLISGMDSEQIVAAASGLDLDDLADLLGDLPEAVNREVLRSLDLSDRLRLEAVLGYDQDSAGGLMNPDTVTVRADVTVEVVLRYLRMRREIPRGTDAVFVVSRNGDFIGSLYITRLLTADPEQPVEELMEKQAPVIRATTPAAEVVTLFENFDLVSAAVIDDHGKLVGRITIDDVVDVMREEASHSVLSMAGLNEEDDMFAPIGISARRRSVWLGVNIGTAFLAAWVAGLFEATLDQFVMLAILMPIVPSMGGIAGTQTLILITRGIALGHVERANARWLLRRELGVAFMNGLGLASIVAVLTSWWFGTWKIAPVIGIALAINLLCAAVTGFAVPLLLKRFGIDPALAGGVILIMITDVVGLVAFLGLGTMILL